MSKIRAIGVYDADIDLFEGQYRVLRGITYNSYVILDEKTAVLDTADKRKTTEWLQNLDAALDGHQPDYLIISHMEPDHAGSLAAFTQLYPTTTLVATQKALSMIPLYFETPPSNPTMPVGEGVKLSLGEHTLQFFPAPMVHWPEVMVSYEQSEKILFSADAFGRFGRADAGEWVDEARRYYLNIVGKYGAPVQRLLKKAQTLDIQSIYPLHGPVLTGDLQPYLSLYKTWSSYIPEAKGVLVAFASIHGHTKEAALYFAERLRANGVAVETADLTRCDLPEALAQAFRFSHLFLAASSYDGGVFPPMQDFLNRLSSKNYQKRHVYLLENGSWAPSAGRSMHAALDELKEVTVKDIRTLRGGVKQADLAALKQAAEEIAEEMA